MSSGTRSVYLHRLNEGPSSEFPDNKQYIAIGLDEDKSPNFNSVNNYCPVLKNDFFS